PLPPAPAFCLGNVIMTRIERDTLLRDEALLAHEARHATQFAWCAGLVMLPLYFTAAGGSWGVAGGFGSRHGFGRRGAAPARRGRRGPAGGGPAPPPRPRARAGGPARAPAASRPRRRRA